MKINKILISVWAAFAVFGFLTFENAFYLIFGKESLTIRKLELLFLYNTIGLFVFVMLLNVWSILKINNITADKPDASGCKYCATKNTGPFLCSGCNSILWYNLKDEVSKSIAVFIAHHRWVFSAALLTVFLFYPLGYIFNSKSEIEKEIESTNSELFELVAEINALQANIEIIETNGNTITPEYIALFEKYRSFTWRSPRLLRKLSDELLRNDADWISAFEAYPNLKDSLSVVALNDSFKSETSKKRQTIIVILTLLNSKKAELNHTELFQKFKDTAKEALTDTSKIAEKKRLGLDLRRNLSLTSNVLVAIATNKWDEDQGRHAISLNVEDNILEYFKGDLNNAFNYKPEFK